MKSIIIVPDSQISHLELWTMLYSTCLCMFSVRNNRGIDKDHFSVKASVCFGYSAQIRHPSTSTLRYLLIKLQSSQIAFIRFLKACFFTVVYIMFYEIGTDHGLPYDPFKVSGFSYLYQSRNPSMFSSRCKRTIGFEFYTEKYTASHVSLRKWIDLGERSRGLHIPALTAREIDVCR